MIFSSRRFFQKTNEQILLYHYDTSGQLVFLRFLKKLKITKRHFEINWPLQNHLNLKISVECALVNFHTISIFSSSGQIRWDNLKFSLLSHIFVHRKWKNQNSFTINATDNFLKNHLVKSYSSWYAN